MTKYVFVTGGVVSGLGKGITAAALGRLLKARGYKVTIQKFDPYFNVDSMYLSPYQHGGIFVTADGGEADLVVGHYERLLGEDLGASNNVTSGQIYLNVIKKEREGLFSGRTVQVVPHITNEIKERMRALESSGAEIIITEIGGTVGDIECHPFLEAIRQLRSDLGKDNVVYVHTTLVPYIKMSAEQKTKPTQRSVKELQNVGIQPDIIVCRSEYPLGESSKKKLSLFCNVKENCIIEDLTSSDIYEVPLKLENEGLSGAVLRRLNLDDSRPAELDDLRAFAERSNKVKNGNSRVKVAIVGKYTEKHDAYASLTEALLYSGVKLGVRPEIVWISAEEITDQKAAEKLFKDVDCAVIATGFGDRGFEGKIAAAQYLRKNNIPVLMEGLGAQAGLIEYARNIVGISDAYSEEFKSENITPVIKKAGCNKSETDKSCCENVFIRGARTEKLKKGTRLHKIYGEDTAVERHRHKYCINSEYVSLFENNGLVFSCYGEEAIPEGYELPGNNFYIGVIYRPEFSARTDAPSKLTTALLEAGKKFAKSAAK